MGAGLYSNSEIKAFAQAVLDDGFCVLPGHFSLEMINVWQKAFAPLLSRHIEREGQKQNRGPSRYYVTLPFTLPFADPRVFEDEDILAIASLLVGDDMVMCQLATDTPLIGSDYQDVHRDTLPLFPETVHAPRAGTQTAKFLIRDNLRYRSDIERAYLAAIRTAQP